MNLIKYFKKSKDYFFAVLYLSISLFFLLSLLSYNDNDISFNSFSTSPEIHNIFGKYGACSSDILLQIFGLTSFIFIFSFIILGIKKFFKKTFYTKNQKIFALIGLCISSSIITSNITYTKYHSNGIISEYIINSLYYIPTYFLNIFACLVFFISISFFLDIKQRWWIIFSAKVYRYTLSIIKNIIKFCKILFYIFTTKRFRENISRFFRRIFSKKFGYVEIDEKELNSVHKVIYDKDVGEIEMVEPNDDFIKNINENNNTNEEREETKKHILPFLNKKNEKENNLNKKEAVSVNIKSDRENNLKHYSLPTTIFLAEGFKKKIQLTRDDFLSKSNALLSVLQQYQVKGEIVDIKVGPVVTLYEFTPVAGTKEARIKGLSNDISRVMCTEYPVRISTIPKKNAIGFELPNEKRETVFIKDVLETKEFKENKYMLPIIIGVNIIGNPVIADLSKMPHLLIAGTTGSGKSVGVNSIIVSLLYRFTPDECKFIMIDPKYVEFAYYEGIPHLLSPIVTDISGSVNVLRWACKEMDRRYEKIANISCKNIETYNDKVQKHINLNKNILIRKQEGFDSTGEPIYKEEEVIPEKMPYIIIIIDEIADLMEQGAKKEVESAIRRLSAKARACGIHLIISTQRPSVNIITGVIKANIPARIAFSVSNGTDSRVIIDNIGAEKLLGKGDMLFGVNGKFERAHSPFISEEELGKIITFIKNQGVKPKYIEEIIKPTEDIELLNEDDNYNIPIISKQKDLFNQNPEQELFERAVEEVTRTGKTSQGFLQSALGIGNAKAVRFLEKMEKAGILTPPDDRGRRKVIKKEDI